MRTFYIIFEFSFACGAIAFVLWLFVILLYSGDVYALPKHCRAELCIFVFARRFYMVELY